MCGIVGAISSRDVAPLILDSLGRLAYRGYDSAGIATLVDGHIEKRRAQGKLCNLEQALTSAPLAGSIGIGHTRWATHGAPTEHNAHPHCTERVSVVHNGIIENHHELRRELEDEGQEFATDTDTEAVAHLLDFNLRRGMTPIEAVDAALPRLSGSYALAMIFTGYPELIVGVQHGAPLAVGFGEQEMFIGSDGLALVPFTRRIAHLSDGDWVVMDRSTAHIFDAHGQAVNRRVSETCLDAATTSKGGFAHYMEKELHEHPLVIRDSLSAMIDPASRLVKLPELPFDFAELDQVSISACGSAFYAGLVGRSWFETIAQLPANADVASEFRYREPPMPRCGLGLLVSQSGETADTLAALNYMRARNQHIMAVVNVPESSIARAADAVLQTRAGPEMSVASTKAFTAQLAMLACLAIAAGRARRTLSERQAAALAASLLALPDQAQEVLGAEWAIKRLATRVAGARDVLFLGRGNCCPIALEGALKLKEISYIHAEGYAAGEMKHGPIALIDAEVPVLGIAPSGPLFEKTASNLQEAAARGGQIIAFTDAAGAAKLHNVAAETIVLPAVEPFAAPILYAIAVQMLAYHTAVLSGTDVDQPRNLAKSVTVE